MPHSLLPYNSILLSQPDPSLWYSIFLPLIINGFCFLPSFLSGSCVWAKGKMIAFFFFFLQRKSAVRVQAENEDFELKQMRDMAAARKRWEALVYFQFHFIFFYKVTFLTPQLWLKSRFLVLCNCSCKVNHHFGPSSITISLKNNSPWSNEII